jgi:ribosome modulation factor
MNFQPNCPQLDMKLARAQIKARMDGYNAGLSGNKELCPFPHPSHECTEWFAGYTFAAQSKANLMRPDAIEPQLPLGYLQQMQ